jgi:hypothetical protein
MTRYAVGADFRQGPFNVRGEYVGAKYEDLLGDAKDGEPWGWYVKAFYYPIPKLRFIGGYSQMEHNWSGFFFTAAPVEETYDQWTVGLDYFLADGVSVMFTYNSTEGERTGLSARGFADAATLEYTRINLGVRATF